MSHAQSVLVLMGGPSAEHDISLKSGQSVVAALMQRGWPVHGVTIPRDLSIPGAIEVVSQMLRQAHPDVVFLALHGPFGEDGTMQQVCDTLQVPYTGSDPEASRLGMDKVASRQRFEQAHLMVPRWRVIEAAQASSVREALGGMSLPLVIKPTNQGSSIGVTRVERREDVLPAIDEAARYDPRVLIETWVQGRELTVGILGEDALPVVEVKPSHPFFDYAAKYAPGQTQYLVPAPLTQEQAQRVQTAGLRAHAALGCRHFSRVDLIMTSEGQPVILEVNTIPGLTAMSLLPKAAACAGLSYDELCERMVLMALRAAQPLEPAAAHPR